MEYESFEKALEICMQAEEGSEAQLEALFYCLDNAPPELKEMLQEQHRRHQHQGGDCSCGSKEE